MTTSNASPTPPGEDAPAGGTHRALNQDEATSTQELLQAVLASDNLGASVEASQVQQGSAGH